MINKTNPKKLLIVSVLLAAIVCSTAMAKTIYVDVNAPGPTHDGSSWATAYKYLQDALADADSSTKPVEIWVARGIYNPDQGVGQTPGDRTAMFQLINGVAIKGGYAGVGATEPNERNVELYETILSGDIHTPGDNSDNSFHVVSGIGTNATALLEGLTITGAQGGQAGGGMFNRDSSPTVTHCVFTGNTVNDYGGGMYNEGSSPTLTNCTFSNNGASYGGGIDSYLSNPTLNNCTFSDNQAISYGGGMYNRGSNPHLADCAFVGNTAARGGGMFNYDNSGPQITNCSFENNRANDYGGAMENYENCNAVITWCSFTNNSADYGGGMINYKSNPELTDCDFSGNQANLGGGMFNWKGSSPVLTDCTFYDNSSVDWHGGGVYNQNSSPVFNRCNFLYNYTWPYSDNAAHGAGMYNYNSTPVLYACTFIGNETTDKSYVPFIAREGGAIYNYDSYAVLYNCNFVENFANWKGGAISNRGSSSVVATNCRFSKNKTGGEFVQSCCGGAISGGDLVLMNCEFVRNSSYRGGAIYSYNTALKLTNCTLVQNTAGLGGAIYDSNSNPVLSNCILWGNSAGQIYTDGGAPFINYCCIQGWTGSLGGVGNIGDEPMFVREPNNGGDIWGDNMATINIDEGANDDYGTLHLLPGSPCIDAGDNTAVPADTNDLDSDGDTTEPIPWDLDGDTRFADEPGSPDTGNGTPPIVDIGAYEGPKQGFLLSTELLTIPEGGTATFTVSLRLDPLGSFVAIVANISDNNNITVKSGTFLIFNSSNYAVPQTVTLQAAEDDDNFDMPALIAVTAPGVVTRHVNVIERDNEPNANTIFVDTNALGANDGSSWENAYTALQDALDKAVSVGLLINHIRFTDFEIWVAQGTYKPDQGAWVTPGDRRAAFKLLAGVSLRGGFAGFGEPEPDARDVDSYETILSGDLDGNDVGEQNDPSRSENSYHVVASTANIFGPTAILEGFTISGGNANADTSGYWSGGGLYLKSKAIIKNCKFQHNRAFGHSGGGGGVYCSSSANTTITDCNFTQNWVLGADGGGAIGNHSGNLVISNCDFNNNSALVPYEGGGAVYNSSTGILTISNCTFSSNDSSDNGGAIYTNSSNSIITDCNFTGNSAGGSGGGVFSSGTVIKCTFNDNSAGSGGGMYNSGTVINCTFSNNSAMNGGGMVNAGSVINCTLMGNSATSGGLTLNTGRGGGIYNAGVSPTVSNCVFIGNSAAADGQNKHGYGGGLYNSAETPIVTYCEFIANSASHYGGGIANDGQYLSYDRECNPTITNCTFIGNTAGSNGGGIHDEGWYKPEGKTTIANCTFAANSNALACSYPFSPAYPSTIEVANSILWDGGDEIRNFDGSTITVSYSNVQGGYVGTGNLDSDPCFVQLGCWVDANDPNIIVEPNDSNAMWVDGNYRLRPDSPCIDAGDNSEPNLGATDLDGHPRIIDGDCNDTEVVDMGAYEFNYAYIGDFDYNCSVDFFDFSIFALTWFTEPTDEQWNPFCNIGIPADSYIDWRDVAILCENWLAGVKP